MFICNVKTVILFNVTERRQMLEFIIYVCETEMSARRMPARDCTTLAGNGKKHYSTLCRIFDVRSNALI